MKKRVLASIMAVLVSATMCVPIVMASENVEPSVKSLEKSNSGNAMLGFDENGDLLYGGDPSILVDGDTVYCYVGHDTSDAEYYRMPDWRCYSTKDMKEWKYEGEVMSASEISWAADGLQAWAGQVAKGSDGKYYFYYCTEANAANGRGKSIGVAVSDKATGPFKDIGHPLVKNTDTPDGAHTWEDIDPTVWIESDEKGEEHRYLVWGNNRFFICELNEDMISIKNQDGNPDNLSVGFDKGNDIVIGKMDGQEIYNDKSKFDGHAFTEAPYYYRQQDENGNYFGPYYMFFASDWREQMAYATTNDLMSNDWKFGGVIMEPSATANTNHMAVFDFKGHTYFVYHDGSLPHGSGFRRVTCVEEIKINEDGSINPISKTAVGLTGTISTIKDFQGNYIANEKFDNVLSDDFYPITDWSTPSLTARGSKQVFTSMLEIGTQKEWEINPGKTDTSQEEYVSIESNDKPGLYLSAGDEKNGMIPIVLAQDAGGTEEEAQRMTFKTLEGFSGNGVTFESLKYPGYYIVSRNGQLFLADKESIGTKEATFFVSTDMQIKTDTAVVQKSKCLYEAGEKLNVNDIRVCVRAGNGKYITIRDITTNAEEIDMTKTGQKELKIKCRYGKTNIEKSVMITVVKGEN